MARQMLCGKLLARFAVCVRHGNYCRVLAYSETQFRLTGLWDGFSAIKSRQEAAGVSSKQSARRRLIRSASHFVATSSAIDHAEHWRSRHAVQTLSRKKLFQAALIIKHKPVALHDAVLPARVLEVQIHSCVSYVIGNAGPEVIPAALANRPVSLTPASQLCRSTVRLPKAHSCIGSVVWRESNAQLVRFFSVLIKHGVCDG